MPRYRHRHGILVPLLLIAGGVLFLLGNLGVIQSPTWETILRFWPVLLIAIGIDLAFGRASLSGALSGVLTLLLIVGLGFVAYRLLAPPAWQVRESEVSVPLEAAHVASVEIACDSCSIQLDGGATGAELLEGTLRTPHLSNLSQSVSHDGNRTSVKLRQTSAPWTVWGLDWRHNQPWHMQVTGDIPIELSLEAGSELDLDLRDTLILTADLSSRDGDLNLVPSLSASASYVIAGRDVSLEIPEELVVLIEAPSSASTTIGEGFEQTESTIRSSAWEQGLPVARVVIRTADRLTVRTLVQESASSEIE